MIGHCEICGQSFSHGQTHWQCYAERQAYIEARKEYYKNQFINSTPPLETRTNHIQAIKERQEKMQKINEDMKKAFPKKPMFDDGDNND